MKIPKNECIRRRFGDINATALGDIKAAKEIVIPTDFTQSYTNKNGDVLEFCIIQDIPKYADRISEIYRNSVDEMVGNSYYEWHHDSQQIIETMKSSDYFMIGCFMKNELIGVVSHNINRGQRNIYIIWGAVDSVYRGNYVWEFLGLFADEVYRRSNTEHAHVASVTTHPWTSMLLESIGFKPMGFFPGWEWFGGADGKYYRHNVVYYMKLYGDGLKYLQDWDSMVLTEQSRKLVEAVKEIWSADSKKIETNVKQDISTIDKASE